ncbi:MAG: phosphonate ABC transporter ATP-binding protein [Deltaproteobacteria bacterium]|jgi:phosphonate transport system ATP-binding protein|nr:phosphonate ABC transporter ATP-binding protein [Deltaproteobacteria bacterium]
MINIRNFSRTFGSHKGLDNISITVRPGEMVALIGASGSGKSTLLRHISGIMAGDKGGGDIRVMGRIVQEGGSIDRHIRKTRAEIGMIFQQFNLVGRLAVLTNVMLGSLGRVSIFKSLTGRFPRAVQEAALEALRRVGIADKAGQRASTLSGGQQQRAAIARAMVQRAKVLLADEPIASLDPESSRRVMDLLEELNRQDGVTIMVSLHQVDYATRYCQRTIALRAGQVVYDGPSSALTPAVLKDIYGAASEDMFGEELFAETDEPAMAEVIPQPYRPGLCAGAAA